MSENIGELNSTVDEVTADLLSNRYELKGEIGSGGMSCVFEAYDHKLMRRVAVKKLQELAHSENAAARMRQEARALSLLQHPNILKVFSFDVTGDGIPFLITEFIEGKTLAQIIEQGPLPVPTASLVLDQIADGLIHAHENGVVHRDLKPDNIMVQGEGADSSVSSDLSVKIMDFGIAKFFDEAQQFDQKLTRTGALIGTPLYLSPEQMAGKPADVRSDIYAFGCLVAETVSGKQPFAQDSLPQVMAQKMRDDLSIVDLGKGISEPLAQVVLKALKRDPEHRYQSMVQMKGALHKALAGGGSVAHERRMPAVVPGKRLWLGGLLTIVLALCAYFYLVEQQERSRKAAEHEVFLARDAEKRRKFREAINHYTNAIAADNRSQYHVMRALARLTYRKETPNAEHRDDEGFTEDVVVPELNQALKMDPNSPAVRLALATALVEFGKLKPAYENVLKGLELDSQNIGLHNMKGAIEVGYGDPIQAEKDFSFGIDKLGATPISHLSPEEMHALAQAYSMRGKLHAVFKRWDKALSDMSAAVNMEPKEARHYLSRAVILIDAGRLAQSITDLQQADDEGPSVLDNQINMLRGRIYAATHQEEQAFHCFDEAVKNRNHAIHELHKPRAVFYLEQGKAQLIIDETEIDSFKVASGKLFALGEAYADKKMYAQAVQTYDLAIKRTKLGAFAALGRCQVGKGNALMLQKNYSAALLSYKAALKTYSSPDYFPLRVGVYRKMCGCYLAQHERKKAQDCLQAALDELKTAKAPASVLSEWQSALDDVRRRRY